MVHADSWTTISPTKFGGQEIFGIFKCIGILGYIMKNVLVIHSEFILLVSLCLFLKGASVVASQDQTFKDEVCEKGSENLSTRYLLYDVNPGEGFNLRRDVYLRVANLVHALNDVEPWTLVLPPWGNLYHWRNVPWDVFHPWADFFDIKSLSKWIPVIEFGNYLEKQGSHLDSAFILQNYENMWEEEWKERYEMSKCLNKHSFQQNPDGKWSINLWKQDLTFTNFSCLSFQGLSPIIIPFLTKEQKDSKSVYLAHCEILLHSDFGSPNYWKARRSMRFAPHLVAVSDAFRKDFLDSDDENDNTVVPADWRDFKPKRGSAVGGPYLAAHIRRRDFIFARKKEVPSIEKVAEQLDELLKKMNLKKLFVASDAPDKEIDQLRSLLKEYKVLAFKPSPEFFDQFGDGGTAIVDQIICSHARFFIGTFESTFSFRIQEEREIFGFSPETTFNRLCGETPSCDQPTNWKIVYS